jgi:hypothetical protein
MVPPARSHDEPSGLPKPVEPGEGVPVGDKAKVPPVVRTEIIHIPAQAITTPATVWGTETKPLGEDAISRFVVGAGGRKVRCVLVRGFRRVLQCEKGTPPIALRGIADKVAGRTRIAVWCTRGPVGVTIDDFDGVRTGRFGGKPGGQEGGYTNSVEQKIAGLEVCTVWPDGPELAVLVVRSGERWNKIDVGGLRSTHAIVTPGYPLGAVGMMDGSLRLKSVLILDRPSLTAVAEIVLPSGLGTGRPVFLLDPPTNSLVVSDWDLDWLLAADLTSLRQ